jgi:DNA-binding NtrC family response regulator
MTSAARSATQRPAVIAIIEDDAAVLEAMTALMEAIGYQVIGGEDAEEVLERMGEDVPDLILADYRLRAGKTGVQAIRRIHDMLGIAVPAIMVTGDTSDAWQAEARAARLPVLQKPVLPRRLVAAIERALA